MTLTPGQIVATLTPIVGRVGAAGIAGNLQQESGDNPASACGGLAQWQGPRYTGLVKYAQARGVSVASPQAALGYLAQDLRGPYSGLAAQLRAAKDPGTAATLFSNSYERPGVPMLGNRINYARQALSSGTATPPGIGGGGSAGGPSPSFTSISLPGLSEQVPTFDQQGYQQAQRRYQVGSFLAGQKNPFDIGPKATGGDASNPLFSSGLLTTQAPNRADFEGTKTVQLATQSLQKIAGTPLMNTHAGAQGYVNPIPGAVIGRTDMGVDANLKPGSAIRAIGDSKVVSISPNWYKGQPYVLMQLLSGPQKGKFYYVAEQIAPSVKAGQTVRAGQPIGTYAQSGTGIEIGWGSPTPGRTLAQATSGYSEGQATPAGGSFRSFLGSLK